MKSKICLHVDKEASRVYNVYNEVNPDKPKVLKPLTEINLNAFIGISISADALRYSKENTTKCGQNTS